MSKPLIGVMPLWDEGKKSIWMLPGYLEGIREAGGDPVSYTHLDVYKRQQAQRVYETEDCYL